MKKIVKMIQILTLPNPENKVGDIIADVAQPIAQKIDSVLGTEIKKCSACEAAKKRLNDEAEKGEKII